MRKRIKKIDLREVLNGQIKQSLGWRKETKDYKVKIIIRYNHYLTIVLTKEDEKHIYSGTLPFMLINGTDWLATCIIREIREGYI